LQGEIITTPFSYIATSSTIRWEGCTIRFADIKPDNLTIDPDSIESIISDKTVAILATHVYGIACDIDKIEAIAKKNNLKVIYDGAHAFGSTYKGKSLLSYGDISTLSTHATKIFHTVEGGGIFANDPKLIAKLASLRNFGHAGPDKFDEVGINGKNSELHAGFGLVNLSYIEEILNIRKEQYQYYLKKLKNFQGKFLAIPPDSEYNFSYLPIIFQSEADLLKSIALLERNKIFPRRYFYPALNELSIFPNHDATPICSDIAKRVMCLPLYHSLSKEEQDLVCRIILRAQNY
jgi:dTDP-4-amino-4,6-dideoxygalactose transaminase